MPAFVNEQVEDYDLFDMQALVATGLHPIRIRLADGVRTSWPTDRPSGCAAVIDLDVSDLAVQHEITLVFGVLSERDMGLLPLIGAHGKHCICTEGLLCTGYTQAALRSMLLDYDNQFRFHDLSLLDVFPCCTGVFVHKVEEARAHNPADPPLRALVKELNLEADAHKKGCRLHGIMTVDRLVNLIRCRGAISASNQRTHAAIVRCDTAQPHHFAVIWSSGS